MLLLIRHPRFLLRCLFGSCLPTFLMPTVRESVCLLFDRLLYALANSKYWWLSSRCGAVIDIVLKSESVDPIFYADWEAFSVPIHSSVSLWLRVVSDGSGVIRAWIEGLFSDQVGGRLSGSCLRPSYLDWQPEGSITLCPSPTGWVDNDGHARSDSA